MRNSLNFGGVYDPRILHAVSRTQKKRTNRSSVSDLSQPLALNHKP